MLRFFRNFAILAGLAMIATLGTASSAWADLIVTATETGFPTDGPTVVAAGSPSMAGGVVFNPVAPQVEHDFTFTGVTLSETQTSALSEVLSSTLTVTNTGSVAHTLTFVIEASGFTSPLAPPGVTLLESLGGTTPVTGAGAPNAISFTSKAGAAPSAPTLSPSITGVGVAYSSSASQSIATGLSGTYSVFQTFVITLNPGANLQFTGRTDLLAVPEPTTVGMAASALPLLGIGMFLRRRHRAKA